MGGRTSGSLHSMCRTAKLLFVDAVKLAGMDGSRLQSTLGRSECDEAGERIWDEVNKALQAEAVQEKWPLQGA